MSSAETDSSSVSDEYTSTAAIGLNAVIQSLNNRVSGVENRLQLVASKVDKLSGKYQNEPSSQVIQTSQATIMSSCEVHLVSNDDVELKHRSTNQNPTEAYILELYNALNQRVLRFENLLQSKTITVEPGSNIEKASKSDDVRQLESQCSEATSSTDSESSLPQDEHIQKTFTDDITPLVFSATVAVDDQLIEHTALIDNQICSTVSNSQQLSDCSANDSVTDSYDPISKLAKLEEMLNFLAESSISAENYSRLEALVKTLVDFCNSSNQSVKQLTEQVQKHTHELKVIFETENELANKCSELQLRIDLLKENSKGSKAHTQQLSAVQLITFNAQKSEYTSCRKSLEKESQTISYKIKTNISQLVNEYRLTELNPWQISSDQSSKQADLPGNHYTQPKVQHTANESVNIFQSLLRTEFAKIPNNMQTQSPQLTQTEIPTNTLQVSPTELTDIHNIRVTQSPLKRLDEKPGTKSDKLLTNLAEFPESKPEILLTNLVENLGNKSETLLTDLVENPGKEQQSSPKELVIIQNHSLLVKPVGCANMKKLTHSQSLSSKPSFDQLQGEYEILKYDDFEIPINARMPTMQSTNSIKCVLVGDKTVGKTTIIQRYTKGDILLSAPATRGFECHEASTVVDGVEHTIILADTGGGTEHETARTIVYLHADVIMLCFAVDNVTSFNNVRSCWEPEVRHHWPSARPIIMLVGTKTEKRHSKLGQHMVSAEQGTQLAEDIKAAKYVECSLHKAEITTVFQETIKAVLNANPNKIWSTKWPTVKRANTFRT